MTQVSVLVVEDDNTLRETLADNLREDGYSVVTAADGRTAKECWESLAFDVVVLDIMLPDASGYDVCRQLKRAKTAARVLMLTARTLEDDVVAGFDAGADDYLSKPYRLRELLARVRALSRRHQAGAPPVMRFGVYVLDGVARSLTHSNGTNVELTRTEFDVLQCLLKNRDRALSREDLLQSVWGAGVNVEERTVDNFISSLKKKLGWTTQTPWRIRTVRGYGYRLELDDAG